MVRLSILSRGICDRERHPPRRAHRIAGPPRLPARRRPLIVTRVDRLARSVKDLQDIVHKQHPAQRADLATRSAAPDLSGLAEAALHIDHCRCSIGRTAPSQPLSKVSRRSAAPPRWAPAEQSPRGHDRRSAAKRVRGRGSADAWLLALSDTAHADHLALGDRRAGLLARRRIGSTRILTAAAFCEMSG